MVRTPKGSKSAGYGFGGRRRREKKTVAQKQAEASGRLLRSMIEKRVREDNPRMNEKQIKQEVKRRMTERKQANTSGGELHFGRYY